MDDRPLSFWRTKEGNEVDFILRDDIAIEVKGTSFPESRHRTGLTSIADEWSFKRRLLVCAAARPSIQQGIEILLFSHFTEELWTRDL